MLQKSILVNVFHNFKSQEVKKTGIDRLLKNSDRLEIEHLKNSQIILNLIFYFNPQYLILFLYPKKIFLFKNIFTVFMSNVYFCSRIKL